MGNELRSVPEEGTCDAQVALLTAQGRGAIAVLRVWGPDALAVCEAVFQPLQGRGLSEGQVLRARVGRIGMGVGDEVVAIVHPGEPVEVEVQCHGGNAAIALVRESLVAAGATAADAVAWLVATGWRRIEREAWEDLARVSTLRAASVLLDQASGALRGEVAAICAGGEEAARGAVRRLIERSAVGLKLVGGWSVVLTGRPNVGKSRLMNVMAGFERAIVAPTPGTTRDVVTVATALAGWPVEICDTAGLRETSEEVEAAGVERARVRGKEADLCLLVLDRSEELSGQDRELIASQLEGILVANKCDLAWAWDAGELGAVEVSAESGEGVEALVEEVGRRLVPLVPPAGVGVPFRGWQVERLERAEWLLLQGQAKAAIEELERLVGEW